MGDVIEFGQPNSTKMYCLVCNGQVNSARAGDLPSVCPHCQQKTAWCSVPSAAGSSASYSLTGVVTPIDQT